MDLHRAEATQLQKRNCYKDLQNNISKEGIYSPLTGASEATGNVCISAKPAGQVRRNTFNESECLRPTPGGLFNHLFLNWAISSNFNVATEDEKK